MLFFVKVRIDTGRLHELGTKLRDGSLDLSAMSWTYCERGDPSVGTSLWEADNAAHLDELLAPLRPFYAEIFETAEVVPAAEAQEMLLGQFG
jgi:hypothetical protein